MAEETREHFKSRIGFIFVAAGCAIGLGMRDFGGYPRWVRSIYYPVTFEAGANWVVWQYCDTAELEGYEGGERFIDLDVLKRGSSLQELMVGQK